MTTRERLARFLVDEYQFRWRSGPFWNDLSIQQRELWFSDADRFQANLARFGLEIREASVDGKEGA